jgi:hypothetical protein
MTHRKRFVYVVPRLIMLVAFLSGVTGSPSVAAKSPESVEPNASMTSQVGSI